MSLLPEESRRYARHLVLKGLGATGQQKLARAKVLVAGAGGLGSPVVAYLAGAGVGRLGILDDDRVAVSNLHRQIVFRTSEAGAPKAEAAARFAAALNPHVDAVPLVVRIGPDNARALLEGFDLVVDGTDDFSTRALLAQTCEALEIPLVSGAVSLFDGQVTTFAPYLCGPDGVPLPRFSCLYPDPPAADALPACEEVGVLGTLAGVVGTMMANEAVKLLTGIGEPLYGRLLFYSARSGETRLLRYVRRR